MPPPRSSSSTTPAKSQQGVVAAKLVRDECRAEANEAFQQHTAETQNLDVLSRCKKLNEFLTTVRLNLYHDPAAATVFRSPRCFIAWHAHVTMPAVQHVGVGHDGHTTLARARLQQASRP